MQMILVAGPYRSGTNDDPVLIARNVAVMTEASLRLFRAEYLPVMGEWYALPLIEHAGSARIGDTIFNEIFIRSQVDWWLSAMPACASAALPSEPMKWARARQHGKTIYYSLDAIPSAAYQWLRTAEPKGAIIRPDE